MLTQVNRGESAPRIMPNHLQGYSNQMQYQQKIQMANQARNNRQAHSLGPKDPYSQGRNQDLLYNRPPCGPVGLIGMQPEHCKGRKTLVLDLDETLVHSQFNAIKNYDYIIPVEMDGRTSNIYVLKRPGVDFFLQQVSKQFEVIIYTASLSKYADPLMDLMDPQGYCTARLFREHCAYVNGVFVKDMSVLGRDMKDTILIDNSPTSYMLQPECGLPILSWYDDMNDRVLIEYLPLLTEMSKINEIREVIPKFVRNHSFDMAQAMLICQQQIKSEAKRAAKLQQKIIDKQNQLQEQSQKQQKMSSQQQQMDAALSYSTINSESSQIKGTILKSSIEKERRPSIQYKKDQKEDTVSLKQNQSSVEKDLQKPLINTWTRYNDEGNAILLQNQSEKAKQESSRGKNKQSRTEVSTQRDLSARNNCNGQINQVKSSQTADSSIQPVTNITNIIYNFNLNQVANQSSSNQSGPQNVPNQNKAQLAEGSQTVVDSTRNQRQSLREETLQANRDVSDKQQFNETSIQNQSQNQRQRTINPDDKNTQQIVIPKDFIQRTAGLSVKKPSNLLSQPQRSFTPKAAVVGTGTSSSSRVQMPTATSVTQTNSKLTSSQVQVSQQAQIIAEPPTRYQVSKSKHQSGMNNSVGKVIPLDANTQRYLESTVVSPVNSGSRITKSGNTPKSYSEPIGLDAKNNKSEQASHFQFSSQQKATQSQFNQQQIVGQVPLNSRSQGGIKMIQIGEKSSGSSAVMRQRGSNVSKVRSFSQNQNNRKVIANFFNSNSGAIQNTTNFARSLQKSVISNTYDSQKNGEANSVLADKYSSLINKSVTQVGWTSGSNNVQLTNPLILAPNLTQTTRNQIITSPTQLQNQLRTSFQQIQSPVGNQQIRLQSNNLISAYVPVSPRNNQQKIVNSVKISNQRGAVLNNQGHFKMQSENSTSEVGQVLSYTQQKLNMTQRLNPHHPINEAQQFYKHGDIQQQINAQLAQANPKQQVQKHSNKTSSNL